MTDHAEDEASSEMSFVRDDDCPVCAWPETYVQVDTSFSPEVNPREVGCRKCGWSYLPPSQILHPYTFQAVDCPDALSLNPICMSYVLTAEEFSDEDSSVEELEEAVLRRVEMYCEHVRSIAETAWKEGAEYAWLSTSEGFNGEYAAGRTHDGAFSFEQFHRGGNPYEEPEDSDGGTDAAPVGRGE